VLRPGGALLAGFNNPALYLFDQDLAEREGIFQVRYRLPYSDFESLTPEQRQRHEDEGSPLEFSHSLEDQIGGQIDAGFLIAGFYEDTYPDTEGEQLAGYFPLFIATRAVKLGRQA
jgi:hypothetical protein